MKFASALVTSISGSIGGMTGSHNRGGMYFRGRAIPTNPNTFRQQEARASMGGVVQAWGQELDDSQRQGWRDYATETPQTDKLGQPLILTGQQMFIRTNTPRATVTARTAGFTSPTVLALIDDAPTVNNTGATVGSISISGLLADDFTIGGDMSAPASATGVIILQVGPPQNPGRTFFKGPWQLAGIGTVIGDASTWSVNMSDVTDPEEWWADALPVIGQLRPFRIRLAYSDGRMSQVFEQVVEITDLTP